MADSIITEAQRAELVAAMKRLGVNEVAQRLGLSRESILRVAGDFGAQIGTEAIVCQRLGRLT